MEAPIGYSMEGYFGLLRGYEIAFTKPSKL
jgi:hypothetical protein